MTSFELKGEGILQEVWTNNSYEGIRDYVLSNRDLLFLKQIFDENPNAMTLDDATIRRDLTA